MPKYLLLKHYRGGPEPHHPFPPMDQWAPEDVEAHMAFCLRYADHRRSSLRAKHLTVPLRFRCASSRPRALHRLDVNAAAWSRAKSTKRRGGRPSSSWTSLVV